MRDGWTPGNEQTAVEARVQVFSISSETSSSNEFARFEEPPFDAASIVGDRGHDAAREVVIASALCRSARGARHLRQTPAERTGPSRRAFRDFLRAPEARECVDGFPVGIDSCSSRCAPGRNCIDLAEPNDFSRGGP